MLASLLEEVLPKHESKKSGGTTRIRIDGIESAQFERLADLLIHWIESGIVKVVFQRPPKVLFIFSEEKVSSELKKNGLPAKDCISQLRYDIPLMVVSILTGQRAIAASFLTDMVKIPTPKPSEGQIKKKISSRIKYIEEKVVTSYMRRQYAVKYTAKTSTYQGVSWDISERRRESREGAPSRLVFATVRIDAVRPPAGEGEEGIAILPMMRSMFSRPEIEALVLTMNLEDLEDLTDNAKRAAQALREAMETEREA